MSKEQEDAAVGAAHRRLREVKETLIRLEIESSRLSVVFKTIGQQLADGPERLCFDRESFDGSDCVYAIQPADLDANKLRSLVKDCRELTAEKDHLEKQLRV